MNFKGQSVQGLRSDNCYRVWKFVSGCNVSFIKIERKTFKDEGVKPVIPKSGN